MKTLGKITLTILAALAILILSALTAYFSITAGAKLDKSRLINYGQTITFYDGDGQKIESSSIEGNRSSVLIENLPEHTKNAFIASEDRTFYSHNGLNYKRMVKALFKNLASFSFKEGASTISQQLIKNTHLSNDKTLKRKLKEIRLTRQLERQYSKDEILEMYLNTIYFGHSCYGIESAARFYFGTDAEELTLCQSATLAGLLSSPNNYSPFKNAEKCLQRRNIVLKSMLECSFIDNNQYSQAINEPLNAVEGGSARTWGSYIEAVFDELDELNFDCYAQLSGCKIYTGMNSGIQSYLNNLHISSDNAIIITDDKNGVCAYVNSIGAAKRQPGSTIKPLLVYAPAIEEGLIHTFTKIDDSYIDFGGYSPENYDKKYHGMVTVSESIAQSYNIPAVKTLNALTTQKAAGYARKMNIPLDDEDNNLSLALGGMKYGTDIKSLNDAYSVFRNGGTYYRSHFIKKIVDKNGKTIYSAQNNGEKVFSRGTCSLMNETLINTAKTGTAKKLKNLPYDIAEKTGTCGDADGNTDAYAIGYTSSHTFSVWLGDANNKKSDITGGGACCNILKDILNKFYSSPPAPLDVSTGTTTVQIDRQDYSASGKIILADDISPKLNKLPVKCLEGKEPSEKSTKFTHPTIEKPTVNINNETTSIVLCQTEYYSYLIKCDDEIIYDGPFSQKIEHSPGEGSHIYSVTPYYSDGEKKYLGDTITLSKINISSNDDYSRFSSPPITEKDWFND